MEGRLFVLSLWCGLYGLFVRQSMRRSWASKTAVVVALNALFWSTFAAMVGMLTASYSEKMDQTWTYTILFSVAGLVIGAALGGRASRNETRRDAMLRDNLEWADTGFSAILLASVVMYFIVQAFKIPSGSMRMTFVEGDHLFVNKAIYGVHVPLTDLRFFTFRHVHRGDIVIFRFPAKSKSDENYGKDFIKRAIATEGQTVEVKNKQVFVDGHPLDEPYKQHVDDSVYPGLPFPSQDAYQRAWEKGDFVYGGNEIRDNFGPVKIPPGHIFVMGDNRDRSFDSRFWGPLDVKEIKGKALLLYWPLNRFRLIR